MNGIRRRIKSARICFWKTFLNLDDGAFGPGLHRHLAQQFPAPSRYERPEPAPSSGP
jgi:hypothetical protein